MRKRQAEDETDKHDIPHTAHRRAADVMKKKKTARRRPPIQCKHPSPASAHELTHLGAQALQPWMGVYWTQKMK